LTSAAALFVVAAFIALLKLLRVAALARAVIDRSRRAFRDLRDPALGESGRERAAKASAGRLLVLFLAIVLASTAAALLPLGAVALLDVAGIVEVAAVLERTLSPMILLPAIPLGIVAAVLLHRLRP
jgi:hypothetical protein